MSGPCCQYAANNIDVVPKASYETARKRARKAEMKVAMILTMHEPYLPAAVDYDCCAHCNSLNNGYIKWPCPTVQMLEEDS